MPEHRERMPKKARFPLFILGLAVIILGSVVANSAKAGAESIGVIVLAGFVLLILSVAIE